MIPVAAAGSVGLRILKTLYKGKKWIGKGSKKAAEFAGKHHAGTSKFITGTSQKVHKGTKFVGKKIKKYPKTASAIGGATAMSAFSGNHGKLSKSDKNYIALKKAGYISQTNGVTQIWGFEL